MNEDLERELYKELKLSKDAIKSKSEEPEFFVSLEDVLKNA